MARLPPKFLDCVSALGQEVEVGQINWYGSATFYAEVHGRDANGVRFTPWLVTCRHNLVNEDGSLADYAKIRLNLKSGQPRDFNLPLVTSGKKHWAAHPDENVDLAVFCLDGEHLRALDFFETYLLSDNHCWTVDEMREAGVAEGDGVFVLGYPLGVMSHGLQRAICRFGCVARIRDLFDGATKSFLIDGQVFPGASGGPVISCPEVAHVPNTKTVKAAALMGIVSHVEGAWVKGEDRPDRKVDIRVKIPAGLAIVQPTDRIREAIAHHRQTLGGE